MNEALADLLARQRALLDTVRRRADDMSAVELSRAWGLVEEAAARVAEEADRRGLDPSAAQDLARARALAALLAAELGTRRGAVVAELARVRAARRRLETLRRRPSDSGQSCDVSG